MKRRISVLLLCLCMMWGLGGCIYSHNYDENGNEMSEEDVRETIDSIKDDIKEEIDRAVEGSGQSDMNQ